MKKSLSYLLLIIVFGLIGYWVSTQINGFLDIRVNPKECAELNSYPDIRIKPDSSSGYQLRMLELAGVGIRPDTAAWGGDYRHTAERFDGVFSNTPPYVNQEAFGHFKEELRTYIAQMAEFNYNALLLGGFLPLISFDKVGDGQAIYAPDDSVYTAVQESQRIAYGELMDIVKNLGLDVYISTDMVALSPPLKKYFEEQFGYFDTENPEFWRVYQLGLEELFEKLPQVDGIMIRTGEAGSIYNQPGANYTSELWVKSEKAIKAMISAFLETAEKYDKQLIFRSWSVGVGGIGDMHTNVETYHQLFDEFESEHFIISTKYCSGDFYAWLPFNPTLLEGNQNRIIEFQCRREYEGMNAFPNYLAPLYSQAINYFAEQNSHISGVWVWPQSGGPLRAGPMSLYPFHGFNLITDLNVFALGELINTPGKSVEVITKDWISRQFGSDSLLLEGLTELLLSSHELTRKGLYISEFAQHDVRALGLEPPPMMWIFEWDLVGGSSSAFSIIYELAKANAEGVIQEGYTAVQLVAQNRQKLEELTSHVSINSEDYQQLINSMRYQENLFTVLADFRSFFMNYFGWLDEGGRTKKEAYKRSLDQFNQSVSAHLAAYSADLDFPAYDFSEAQNLGKRAANSDRARGSLFLVLVVLVALLLLKVFRPMLMTDSALLASSAVLLFFVALPAFTAFKGWWFWLFNTGLAVTYVGSTMGILHLSGYRITAIKSVILLIPGMLIILLLLAFSLPHGPMQFWYQFWTSGLFRTLFFIFFIVFLLLAYVVFIRFGTSTIGLKSWKAVAVFLVVQGIQLIIGATITLSTGFESLLTLFNNELMILPGGLSKIMGITTHLDIPLSIPSLVLKAGIVLLVLGLALWIPGKKSKNATN